MKKRNTATWTPPVAFRLTEADMQALEQLQADLRQAAGPISRADVIRALLHHPHALVAASARHDLDVRRKNDVGA